MATKRYKCTVCGYIHEGDAAPEKCPQCQQPANVFVEIDKDGNPIAAKPKKSLNKESNTYIFVYTAAIIVIVSLLLSFTSGALKSRQAANIELDTKKQILKSLPSLSSDNADIAALYKENVAEIYILNEQGDLLKQLNAIDDFNYAEKEGEYRLYLANVDGLSKWIVPLKGAGLWGAIWGYLALEYDGNTVEGVYFGHAGETPGLGANICTDAFCNQFKGKHIMNTEGELVSIAVMKGGQTAEGREQVDAISGATITSKGVEAMLETSLAPYAAFFANIEKPIENIGGIEE